MMICLFLRYDVYTEKTMQITVVWDVTLCSLLAFYRHSFVYFSCPFRRCLTQMEFKRSQFVGVSFEVIISVTNKLMALLHVRPCILVNT
jgi:hypothetical protein